MPETIVYLGNVAATLADNVTVHEDKQITRLEVHREPGSPSIDLIASGEGGSRESRERRERLSVLETLYPEDRPYFLHLEDLRELWWDTHSTDPADWVECETDDALAQAIANHFGCPVGRPADWDGPQVHPHDLPGGGAGPDVIPTGFQLCDFAPALWRAHEHNLFAGEITGERLRYLMTTYGQDGFYGQHLSTSAQPAAFNYGALSANTTTETTATTTLPGEITTAGGGLLRKAMTYAHTTGTNTGTLTATWTVNGSDSIPVTVAKLGVCNHASTAATCGYEKLLSSTATLSAVGDALTVTFTLTRS